MKICGFERGHLYHFQLVLICVFLKLELGWVKVAVDAKVDLQTQRANTRFDVKACQPI